MDYPKAPINENYRSTTINDFNEVLRRLDGVKKKYLFLKQLPISLGLKREIHANGIFDDGINSGHAKCRPKIKKHRQETEWMPSLWKSYFRYVAATQGEGAVAVFRLLRTLLFLNTFLFIVIISFLVIPQICFLHGQCFLNSSKSYVINSTVDTCSKAYNDQIHVSTNKSLMNSVYQVIIGGGWLEQTTLFYGGYMPVTVSNRFISYSIPWAYFLTVIAVSVISLLMIVLHSCWSFSAQSNSKQKSYSAIVFASWEHSQQEPKKVGISKKIIFTNIVGKLNGDDYAARFLQLKLLQKMRIYLSRLFAFMAIILMLISSGYAIYTVQLRASEFRSQLEFIGIHFLMEYLPTVTLLVLQKLNSKLLELIVSLMDFECETSVMLTLGIQVVIKYFSMAVFMYGLSSIVNCNPRDFCNAGTGENSCEKILCWETYIGQQFYKLMLGQLCEVFLGFLFDILAYAVLNRLRLDRLKHLISFNVSKSVLDLIYLQLIVWIGTIYCPYLPGIAMIFLIIYFYSKLMCCYNAYTPTCTPYKATLSPSFFFLMIICSYILSMLSLFYNVIEVKLSKGCGPFRGSSTIVAFASSLVHGWSVLSRFLIKTFIYTILMSLMAAFVIILAKYFVVIRKPRSYAHPKVNNKDDMNSSRC